MTTDPIVLQSRINELEKQNDRLCELITRRSDKIYELQEALKLCLSLLEETCDCKTCEKCKQIKILYTFIPKQEE